MNKILSLILLLSLTQNPLDIIKIREMYVNAVDDKKAAEKLIGKLEKKEESPLINGYIGAVKMLLAKHALNPIRKLSNFNEGKKELDNAIMQDKTNIELRYLRHGIQLNVPSFLKYNSNIEEDRLLLKGETKNIDADLSNRINNLLLKVEIKNN